MPLVGTRPSSYGQTQTKAAAAAAIEKLRNELKMAKRNIQILLHDNVLEPVNEILKIKRARQGNATSSQPSLVSDIISELDSDVCSRLQIPDIERGLYLLAASLYLDSSDSQHQNHDIETIKVEIGRDTLLPLLEFFTNASNPERFRRWAGILLRELLQGSSKNVDALALGSDDSRRGLGNMLSTESNDYLRIICGHVIKELVDAQYPRESIWPVGTSDELYESFPDSSQTGRWNQLFQNYLDDHDSSQNLSTCLYFAQDVRTAPFSSSGRPGHTTNIVTDSNSLTIWTPASGTSFDQFIDISLRSISAVTITTKEISTCPSGIVKMDFEIRSNEAKSCFLNGSDFRLHQVTMNILTTDANLIKIDLSKLRPELNIRDISSSDEGAFKENVDRRESKICNYSSTADSPVVFHEDEREPLETIIWSAPKPGHADGKKSEGFSNLESVNSGERRISSGKSLAIKDPIAQKPSSTGQNHTTIAGVSKAKTTIAPNRRTSNDKETGSSENFEPAVIGSGTTTSSKANSGNDVENNVRQSSSLQEKVERLSQIFPSHDSAVLRGVLVVSQGNLDLAVESLLRGHESNLGAVETGRSDFRAEGVENLSKSNEWFNLASLTSPVNSHASTPQLNKPMSGRKETAPPQRYPANNSKGSPETRKGFVQVDARTGKNPARYSLKAKQPLAAPKTTKKAAKSEEKPRVTRRSGAGEKPKPTRTPDASIADLYLIDATDDEIEIKGITASQKRRKAGAKANNKAVPKKIGARKRKLAQTDPRQKRSAPAQAEKPTVTTRGRRRAANDAALKIRKAAAIEIDIEDAENGSDEEEPEVTTKAANDEKTPCRSSIQAAIEDREHEGRQGSGTSLKKARCYLNSQQDNATDSWPHDDDQMALRPESESELYDISPKRPVDTAQYISQPSMDSLVSGSKRKSDGADYFSLKLGDMLACIDNELAPQRDQNMQEKLKLKDDADLKHICGVSNHHLKDGSKPRKMVNSSSSPSKEIPPRNPEERLINASHNEGSSKHSKFTNVKAAASVLEDLAERPSVVGLPGAHHSPADESPFQHGIDDQILTQQEELFVQAAPIDKIVERSKNSTPARPTDVGYQVTPDVEGKRKAVHEVLFSAKRKRVRGDETQASSVPTWPSQHLSNQTKEASQALNDFLSDKPLLDDRLTRKVHIVTFGVNGALNQGLASTLRSSDIRGTDKEPVDNGGSPAGKRMKRMSEFAINSNSEAEIPNRLIKRRSASPQVDQGGSQASEDACLDCSGSPSMIQDQIRQASKLRFQESRDHRDRSRAEGNQRIRRNSPSSSQRSRDIQNRDLAESQNQAQKTSRPSLQLSRVDQKGSPFARDHQTRRTFKSSSQASRADENGSPRALVSAERVDHFSRVKRKLLGDSQPADDGKTDLARNLFKIFEPRPRLSIPKTGPSSPQNVESRYVKHQKIENGLYEGVETKEVVVADDSMADPFVGRQARPTSNFTDQLQAGFASENCTPMTVHRRKKAISIPNQTARISETPIIRKATVVVNNQEGHSRLPQTVFTYEEQTTPGNEEQLISSSTDLTSSSTVPENEFPPNEDHSDTWNLALRPHYQNLSIMAHRLADEVIIRLTSEEDAMGVLITQYKKNGGTLLNHMAEKRENDKSRIAGNIEQQKKELLCVYGEAQDFINDAEKKIKSSTLSKFEKQWRKEQEDIRRRIDDGRKMVT